MLRELNANADWRALYGGRSARLKDQELLLRFFALFERAAQYHRPVKGFLNSYLADNVDRTRSGAADLISTFEATVAAINAGIGSSAFRPVRSLNAAVVDSIMVGVARRVVKGPIVDPSEMRALYDDLIHNDEYSGATVSSTAAEESVSARLRLATEAFDNLV
jgi:hypothetical protein